MKITTEPTTFQPITLKITFEDGGELIAFAEKVSCPPGGTSARCIWELAGFMSSLVRKLTT